MAMAPGVRLWIGLAATVLAGALTVALVTDPLAAPSWIALAGGWSYVLSGLVLWARRPTNRTGPLTVLVGITFFCGLLFAAEQPALQLIGSWVVPIHLAIFTHVLLAFPSGRLMTTRARVLVVATYVDLAVVFHAPLGVTDQAVGATLAQASYAVAAVLFAASSLELALRWRAGSPAWRRSVALVLWPGALTLALLAFSNASFFVGVPVGQPPQWAFRIAFALMPLAFLAVLLRSHLARASVAGLVVELDKSRESGALRAALARTLGDPTLEVAYWLPGEARYVDIDGRPVELPADGDERTATVVERDGRRVAAIVHDRALDDEPDLTRAAGAAAALALDNERLQAELRARLDELSASRARIVRAADQERKRIERNLHDGTQQRLTSVAMALGLAETELRSDPSAARATLRQAKEDLGAALAELRELSQGIHPGTLTTRGLDAAVRDLAYSAPLPVRVTANLNGRLPESVEAGAYYVVAEALANVTKHGRASMADVRLSREPGRLVVSVRDDGVGGADPSRGSGLRGLADRIHALGGALEVSSPAGRGTDLRAVIPCA
jgi:signal transduction histidine kinase